MSAVAALFNIPGIREEFDEWSFAHAAHHNDIIRIIYEQQALTLPQFILDPFDPDNSTSLETWLYQHHDMHQQLDAILGIAGFDLSTVDWKDERQRAAWIQLNANEHFQAANILRIG